MATASATISTLTVSPPANAPKWHHVNKDYYAKHTVYRGREWQADIRKGQNMMGFAPIVWVDEIGFETVTGNVKRIHTVRAWFKNMDFFDAYMEQPHTLAVLANAYDADIPLDEARKTKEFVRVLEVSVKGKPKLHEIGAYYLDVEVTRFDP